MRSSHQAFKKVVLEPDVVGLTTYLELVTALGDLMAQARAKVAKMVNQTLVMTYWQMGRYIVEYEQNGADRAKYGAEILTRLSHDLTIRCGRGFGKSNLVYMRKLYRAFPKGMTASYQLTWSHYLEILKSNDALEIGFYCAECARSNYDVGQMNMYLNYFRSEEGSPKDAAPIGIILASENDEMVVKFATQGITNKIFVSRYQLYLPDKEQLRRELAIALEEETRRLARTKRKGGVR